MAELGMKSVIMILDLWSTIKNRKLQAKFYRI